MSILTSILDEISTESISVENEVEIYIRTEDRDQFADLANVTIYQEQYGFKVDKSDTITSGSRHRVRYSIESAAGAELERTYLYCIKMRNEDGTDTELEFTVDDLVYRNFKLLADHRLIKKRYMVPTHLSELNGSMYEVDVFQNKECPWVKIDLELPTGVILSEGTLGRIKKSIHERFKGIEEYLVVTPDDKLNGTVSANTAHKLMDTYAVEVGPFIKES